MALNETNKAPQPEVWLRGPIPGITGQLQPVAHALLQAAEEIEKLMDGFSDRLLWNSPGGVASPAFHLQHIPGVISRLTSYANNQQLNNEQLKYLSEEGLEQPGVSAKQLTEKAIEAIHHAVENLRNYTPELLSQPRGVGRKNLPSTVAGLLFHSAEHTMRHVGQLLVTVRVLRNGER